MRQSTSSYNMRTDILKELAILSVILFKLVKSHGINFCFYVVSFGVGTQKGWHEYLNNKYIYSFGFIGFSVIVLNRIFIVGIGLY